MILMAFINLTCAVVVLYAILKLAAVFDERILPATQMLAPVVKGPVLLVILILRKLKWLS